MADVLAVRDEKRTQHWAMAVQECAAGGLSNREFCRESYRSFVGYRSDNGGNLLRRPA